MTSEICG
jgi:hypothetical protein